MPDDQHHGGEYQRQHRIRQLVDVVHSASPISSVPDANVPGTARERRFGQFGSAASGGRGLAPVTLADATLEAGAASGWP